MKITMANATKMRLCCWNSLQSGQDSSSDGVSCAAGSPFADDGVEDERDCATANSWFV
jgi:hypothetical protein